MIKNWFFIIMLLFSAIKIDAQCNGMSSLCSKTYNNVAYLTTHNAFNSDEDDFTFPNQNLNITSQLNAGVRALMIDVYDVNGTPTVYHGSRFLGSEPLKTFLIEIKTFLDNNPNEIVTIILECDTTANEIEGDINSSGLNSYLYTHTGNNWPTLQNMIDNGTRLVVFSDKNDAKTSQGWYHYLWDYAVETHYSANSSSDFDCGYNRGKSANDLFILNHFITSSTIGVGDESQAQIINSNPYFINRVLECYQEKNKFPNFITIDFYDKGNGLDVVNQLNTDYNLSTSENSYAPKLFIHPNPSKDFIKILGLNKNNKYTIYNSLGIKISSGSISNNEQINIQEMINGIYFLKFENDRTFKFIKV